MPVSNEGEVKFKGCNVAMCRMEIFVESRYEPICAYLATLGSGCGARFDYNLGDLQMPPLRV
jgi:hypothetical protein